MGSARLVEIGASRYQKSIIAVRNFGINGIRRNWLGGDVGTPATDVLAAP
jgi:hypothetical protein